MDNLTHSLVGALIGQTGLKTKTGLATPTLILAANLPDIDALFTLNGVEALAMRRGLTHGPVALLLLPLILSILIIGFDRWQTARGTRPKGRLPLDPRWIVLLAFLGCASHPALDWLNNYGIRLLEPFSSRWFYGDTLFIIDVWIWGLLIPLAGFSWLAERKAADWRLPASIALGILAVYTIANGLISSAAERMAIASLRAAGHSAPLAVASPPPLTFWKRDIFWRSDGRYGSGQFIIGKGGELDVTGRPDGLDHVLVQKTASERSDVQAFLFWSRMPVAVREDGMLVLRDQRYMHPLARGRFEVRLGQVDADRPPQ